MESDPRLVERIKAQIAFLEVVEALGVSTVKDVFEMADVVAAEQEGDGGVDYEEESEEGGNFEGISLGVTSEWVSLFKGDNGHLLSRNTANFILQELEKDV